MGEPLLIVGLGNPGDKYAGTRHNIGAEIVKAFADKYGLSFSKVAKVEGYIAQGAVADKKVILLCPTTFMNLSGNAVRKAMSYFGVEREDLLVLSDDIYISFGAFRMRSEGSAGGHNGLKSITEQIGGQNYPRLRIGIGQDYLGNLSDFVLKKFRSEEQDILPEVLREAIDILDIHIKSGIKESLPYANSRKVGIDQGEQNHGEK